MVSGTFVLEKCSMTLLRPQESRSLHDQYTFWIYSPSGQIYLKSSSSPDESDVESLSPPEQTKNPQKGTSLICSTCWTNFETVTKKI